MAKEMEQGVTITLYFPKSSNGALCYLRTKSALIYLGWG